LKENCFLNVDNKSSTTTSMKNRFWKMVAILSGVYIFIPEFTDVIPIIGWLDEATALGVLIYALKQLGYDLKAPFRKKSKVKPKTILS
jgi:uncharacterized membrane protein YkvA (DUF1232 family)